MRGEHLDVLVDAGGEVVWARTWAPNVIVDSARSLLRLAMAIRRG